MDKLVNDNKDGWLYGGWINKTDGLTGKKERFKRRTDASMLNELSFIQSIQSFINTVCNHHEIVEFVFLDVSWNQSTIWACPDIVNKRTKWKSPPRNSCYTLSSVCLRGGNTCRGHNIKFLQVKKGETYSHTR